MRTWLMSLLVMLAALIAAFFYYLYQAPTTVPAQTISDGVLRFGYPPEFGMAIRSEQILVSSYIPPCSSDFDYCFYYNGKAFQGSNFESAGIRLKKRPEMATERLCLETPPEGFAASTLPDGMTSANLYAASIFSHIGDAAAGHFASGELYRIFTAEQCYEIETRIGETRFENYPEGEVKKFTESDRDLVYQDFRQFLNSIVLEKGLEKIRWPESEN